MNKAKLRDQQLALIWRDTHKDYKGKIDGVPYIMVLRVGGTHSVPLDALTDEEVGRKFADALKSQYKTELAVWDEARAAAVAAAKAENARLGPENTRGLDCGFAWVDFMPARGPFVAFLKVTGRGYKRTWGGGGWEVMASQFHDEKTQSVSVDVAAARAAAEVFRKHGITEVYTGSRLD